MRPPAALKRRRSETNVSQNQLITIPLETAERPPQPDPWQQLTRAESISALTARLYVTTAPAAPAPTETTNLKETK